ncbi:MAG: T9SS type A sorting domain-containing protein [bacterium]
MKNIFKFRYYLLVFFFISFVSNASEKDKICPFELISFDYRITTSPNYEFAEIELLWKTASEMNTDKFIIEKAYDNDSSTRDFFPIGEVKAAGTSNEIHTYNFFDTIGLGNFAFRIKGVDKDSSFGYSSEIFIDNYVSVNEQRILSPGSMIENIYPNPSRGIFSILLKSNVLGYFNTSIFDDNGVILNTMRLDSSKELINMDLSEYPSGEYYINVSRGTFSKHKKIVIIK